MEEFAIERYHKYFNFEVNQCISGHRTLPIMEFKNLATFETNLKIKILYRLVT